MASLKVMWILIRAYPGSESAVYYALHFWCFYETDVAVTFYSLTLL